MTISGGMILNQVITLIVGGKRLVVLALTMTVGLTVLPPTAAQDATQLTQDSEYVKGVKAFAEGNFEQAADLWLADAHRGAPDAQFNIGVLYIEGKGLPLDRGEAISWFTKAANQGHPEAQYNLGHLLLEQTGDVDKIREGIDWWRKSAESGYTVAQYNYGRALYYGVGAEENREASRPWIEKAAQGGNISAQNFLEHNKNNFVTDALPASVTEPSVAAMTLAGSASEPPPSFAEVTASDYVVVKEKPILMYSRFNTFSPIITRVGTKILLRVVARKRNWILAEVPGGVPGWVRNDQLVTFESDRVEITADTAMVYADPTEKTEANEIGELLRGTKPILLEQHLGWSRIQLPEKISGWIEADQVDNVEAPAEEVSRIWQAQRIKQNITALSSREIKIADVPRQSLAAAVPAAAPAPEPVIEPLPGSESVATSDPTPEPEANVAAIQKPTEETLTASVESESVEETEVMAEQVAAVYGDIAAVLKSGSGVESAEAIAEAPAEKTAISADGPEPSVEMQGVMEQEPATEAETATVVESSPVGHESAGPEVTATTLEPKLEPESVVGPDSTSVTQPALESEPEPLQEKFVVSPRKADEALRESKTSSSDQETVSDVRIGEVLEQGIAGRGQFASERATIRRTRIGQVPVRAGPDTSEPQIILLPLNTLVDIVGTQRGFAEITIPGGIPVWIPNTSARFRGQEVVIEANRVRARLQPDSQDTNQTKARILGIIPQGSVLRLVQKQGEWLRVVAPEWITGWIATDTLETPRFLSEIERVWQRQSKTLVAGYVEEEIVELAVVPRKGDADLIGTGVENDNKWLFDSSSGKFTLQLFSMKNLSSAKSLFSSLNNNGQFFSTVVNSDRWYFMLFGKFQTAEAAEAAADTLPRWARESRVRSLNRLQINRCKKVDQLSKEESQGLDQMCRD